MTAMVNEVGGKLVFVATKGLGLEEKEFVIFNGVEGKKYDEIKRMTERPSFIEVNGKIAYVARERVGAKWTDIMVLGDKELGKYNSINSFVNVNGKLAYVAGISYSQKVIFDGKELKYEPDSGLVSVGDKVAFLAVKPEKYYGLQTFQIALGDQIIGSEYQTVSDLADIGGKLAYIATKKDVWPPKKVLVIDGVEIPFDVSISYLANLMDIGGKVAYVGNDKGPPEYTLYNQEIVDGRTIKWPSFPDADKYGPFLFFDGRRGKVYPGSEIRNIIDVNGKPAFEVFKSSNDEGARVNVVVYDNKESNPEYESWGPVNVGGKIAFTTKKNGKYVAVLDWVEGKEYDEIFDMKNIGGHLAYTASDKDGMFVVFDGKEGKHYKNIASGSLIDINGKLAYMAADEWDPHKGGGFQTAPGDWRYFIVYDGKEFGKKYADVSNLMDLNGKLAYGAETKLSIKKTLSTFAIFPQINIRYWPMLLLNLGRLHRSIVVVETD